MGGMTLDLVNSTQMGDPDINEMEKNPEDEMGRDGVNKTKVRSKLLT